MQLLSLLLSSVPLYAVVAASSTNCTPTFWYPAAATSSLASSPTALPLFKNASFPYLGTVSTTAINKTDKIRDSAYKNHCIVVPHGRSRDDSSQILAAVDRCGKNGIITLPAPYVYTISRRMYLKLENARLEVLGTISLTPDLLYWIENSFRVEFQNQSTALIIEAHNSVITGGGWDEGGIDGNGQSWMTRAAGHSNQFGRPILLSIYNSTNLQISNFTIRNSPFWNIWVQDSSHIEMIGMYINGTNTDPAGNSSNYETNLDGLNTYRVDHLTARDWVFHGGDDCITPKGNSSNLKFENITCIGGGIAFGSVGQYPGHPDYITNVTINNVTVGQDVRAKLGGAVPFGAVYFKSWVGVEAGTPPHGGGGGTGRTSNVKVTNLRAENIQHAVYINKCYHKVPSQGAFCDTSTYRFENISFFNVTGTVTASAIDLDCSAAAPCRGLDFKGIDVRNSETGEEGRVSCANLEDISGIACNQTL